MTAHTCHAMGCRIPVPPRYLMCPRHWGMVPRGLQRGVWAHYRKGQEIDKQPTLAWMQAARAAIVAVARKEGRRVAEEFEAEFQQLAPSDIGRPE